MTDGLFFTDTGLLNGAKNVLGNMLVQWVATPLLGVAVCELVP